MASLTMMSTGAAAAAASFAGSRRRGVGCNSSCFMAGGDKTVKHLSVCLKRQQQQQQRRGRDGGVVVYAAKGRNARLAGRDRKAQQREDDKMLDGRDAADEKREAKAQEKVKREPGVKYSKRGKVSSQPGQVSKAALKRIREATSEAQNKDVVDEERAAEKRDEYRKGIPERVTDRMLKRIAIFSGVPLLLGFSTGPIFYGLKVVAHVDVAPWWGLR